MEFFLLLGFVVGMGHALEADHLVAVGTLATGKSNRKSLVMRGAVWGLGHTLTLFAISTAVIVFGLVLTDKMTAAMEFSVGVLLVILGFDVLRRMRKSRVHFHVHDHGGGKSHLHAHSHLGATVEHDQDPHEHRHWNAFPVKALIIGLMHGAAGSAGLLALAVAASRDSWLALTYVALFGLGSIVGMAALTFIASWPLGWAEKSAARLHTALQLSIACLAVAIGAFVMLSTANAAWGG